MQSLRSCEQCILYRTMVYLEAVNISCLFPRMNKTWHDFGNSWNQMVGLKVFLRPKQHVELSLVTNIQAQPIALEPTSLFFL